MSPSLPQPQPVKTDKPSHGKSLAEIQLERIVIKQDKLFSDLQTWLATASSSVQQQKVNEVDTAYRSFILDNPDYIYGYMLYGKFLRAVGEYEAANIIFVKANDLQGDYAVIKQQIGNYLAEEGEFVLALAYLVSAIELEPDTAVYHFQLGQLLHTYRDSFIASEILTAAALARQQFTAFENAARLAPHNRTLQMRYAEAYFDAQDPDWSAALRLWQALETSANDPVEREIIHLQKARVYIELNQYHYAKSALTHISHASLQESRQRLLNNIAHIEAKF